MKQRHNTRSCDVPGCRGEVLSNSAIKRQQHMFPFFPVYICSACTASWTKFGRTQMAAERFNFEIMDNGYTLHVKVRELKSNFWECAREHLPDVYYTASHATIVNEHPKLWFVMISPLLKLEEFQSLSLQNAYMAIHILKYRYVIWRNRYCPERLKLICRRIDAEVYQCEWDANCDRRTRKPSIDPSTRVCPFHQHKGKKKPARPKKMQKWESDWWLTMAAISKTIDTCTEQCNSKQGD